MKRLVDEALIECLALAPDPESSGEWPAERIERLAEAGGFRWGFPDEFGGIETTDGELLIAYMDLARQCLTTAFILTQRNAACQRLAACENDELKQRLLADHCLGRRLATVGISHLSTSRQHWSRPSVSVTATWDGFELKGEAPWVTGGRFADLLVTGGSLADGQQILVAIPTDRAGVTVCDPLRLLALNESCTGSVLLDRVAVSADEIIFGPVPQVMKIGSTGGTGSLTTTAVAVGTIDRLLDHLRDEVAQREGLEQIVEAFLTEQNHLRRDLLKTAATAHPEHETRSLAEQLRFRANLLVARVAQALMASAKGSGFIAGHPAERAIREAMFFQVWSCPPAVTTATLNDLTIQ